MGHLRNGHGVYGRLQKRLDRYPIGAPPADAIYEILKRLYTEEEAEIGARMPIRFTDIDGIARRTGKRPDALRPVLERMAEKGLVMDFENQGKVEYLLSPTLFGFFEFTFMRVRDDVPQKELARYMVEYAHDRPDLARSVLAGKIQGGRTLVHETAVDPEDATRILDYERAEQIIREAKAWAVSLCYCRHVLEHEGKSCEQPMEVCTTLNAAADFLVRRGLARKISREEMLDIFAATREAGLAHIGDNVKRRPAFVCHCCGCCCAMLTAINRFRMFDAVITSPFLAAIDAGRCSGCGRCAKKCPIDAIEVGGEGAEAKAAVHGDACLGCGVCRPACATGALSMEPRKERVIVPETAWHRAILMAIERGKFQNLLFDDFERLDHAVLRVITRIVVALPPVKKALLAAQVPSRFFRALAG
ncbi:MAG TPA: 4Fe-4S dicluster domain-containing protein [Candidatus Deferrimicrobiaceae bacterium]|nr:4Fe-4S dicluster domain-containing protein [Candidatus Deferrimicrobiaceae bacterium]